MAGTVANESADRHHEFEDGFKAVSLADQLSNLDALQTSDVRGGRPRSRQAVYLLSMRQLGIGACLHFESDQAQPPRMGSESRTLQAALTPWYRVFVPD
jgi:hypothetical protein